MFLHAGVRSVWFSVQLLKIRRGKYFFYIFLKYLKSVVAAYEAGDITKCELYELLVFCVEES